MQRKKVVFPEPLAPMRTTTSPRATSMLTPRNTSKRPKRLCTSRLRTMSSDIAPTFYPRPPGGLKHRA